MADAVFEAMQDNVAADSGGMGGFSGMANYDPAQAMPLAQPEPVAPRGGTLGEQTGLTTGFGRYQKYFDALTSRLRDQYEPPKEPTLADRLGIFAMAMSNPEMARDVLRQKAAEELARKNRNQELQNSILLSSIKMGELEARSEEADRDYQMEMIRTNAYAEQVRRSGERRGAGRAVDSALDMTRRLKLEEMRLDQADPNRKMREAYYTDLLRNGLPGVGGRQRVNPQQARQLALEAYPMPRAGDEMGIGSTLNPDNPPDVEAPSLFDTIGGMEGQSGPGVDPYGGTDPTLEQGYGDRLDGIGG